MAIPFKYLPEPPNPVRLRLVMDQDEADRLAPYAATTKLSLASFFRSLGLAVLAGRIKMEDVIAAAKPFRAARAEKVATIPGKPGRPRKKAAT